MKTYSIEYQGATYSGMRKVCRKRAAKLRKRGNVFIIAAGTLRFVSKIQSTLKVVSSSEVPSGVNMARLMFTSETEYGFKR